MSAVPSAPRPSPSKHLLGATVLSFLLSERGYAWLRRENSKRHALKTSSTQAAMGVLPSCEEYRELMQRSHGTVPYQPSERLNITASAKILLHPLFCLHPKCLPAAVRAGLRGFVSAYSVMALLDVIPKVFRSRGLEGGITLKGILSLFIKSRTSLSFARFASAYLFLYRILLRSLTFHPITSGNPALPPFLAASLASPALLLDTSSTRRISIALYIATKTSQYVYQAADENGFLPQMPWWWGRWLMFIFSSAHLVWCFMNDPESFPATYGRFIIARSSTYVNPRPDKQTTWPYTWEIVEGCHEIIEMGFPAFDRNKAMQLDGVFKNLRPVFEKANAGHTRLMCALLHPKYPHCWQPFFASILQEWPRGAKFISVFVLFNLALRGRSVLNRPLHTILRAALSTAQTATFFSMSLATAWGTVCALQHLLPGWFLPRSRIAISGFLGGAWILCERPGRQMDVGLYTMRMSIETIWRGLERRGVVRGIKGGETLYFGLAMGCLMALMRTQKDVIGEGYIGAMVSGLFDD